MAAVSEVSESVATFASVTERVLADALRSFSEEFDRTFLEQEVHDVVSQLWSDTNKVTTFIPVLALRDLRDRLNSGD